MPMTFPQSGGGSSLTGVTSSALTALGTSGNAITSGTENTIVGVNSGAAVATGNRNVAIGKDCLSVSTDSPANIAIGVEALKNLGASVTQAGTVPTKSYNIAIGDQCLKALGQVAGTPGLAYENICIGNNVGIIATTAYYTTGMGSEALRFLTTGSNNAGYGVVALHGVTTGSNNVGFGGGTGMDANGLASDDVNTLAVKTGSYNSFFGHLAQCAAVNQPDHMTVIGSGARGNKDNSIFLGRNQDFVNIGFSANTARLSISGQGSTSWPQINLDLTGNLVATPLANANAGDIWYSPGGTDAAKSIIMQLKSNVVYGLSGSTNVPAVTSSNTIDYQALLTGVRTFGPSGFNGNYNLFIGKGNGNTSMGGTTAQGTANICLGIGVGVNITTGSTNFMFGSGAVTTGNNNIIIGAVSGVTTGSNNFVAGTATGTVMAGAAGNVIIAGNNTATALTTGVNSVLIGNVVANSLAGGGQNVVVGYGSASNLTSSNNCILGYTTGAGLTSGGGNTILGGLITGITSSLTNTMILSHSGTSTQATALIVANATVGRYTGAFYDAGLPSSITTVGNATYTAAQLVSGVILRSGNATGVTDTTPTAAQIVAAIPNAVAGQRAYLYIQNNNTTAGTITLAAGTGVTLSGTTNVTVGNTREYLISLVTVTGGSEAVTIYGIQTATA